MDKVKVKVERGEGTVPQLGLVDRLSRPRVVLETPIGGGRCRDAQCTAATLR